MKFLLLIFTNNMLVRSCSAQKHHFNNIILLNERDIDSKSSGYVISINTVTQYLERKYFYFMD